jgi:tetraacyldisaccharide 4'-kinase
VGSILSQQGYIVAFLSRGYRRRHASVAVVAPGENVSWERVGDEPALLHANLPGSWLGVGASRSVTARLLEPRLPPRSVFILDDGFQHRGLHRDIDIVCLPADPFGDALLPAGPLREPLSALRRAQVVCITGTAGDDGVLQESRRRILADFPNCHVCLLHQVPAGWFALSGRRMDAAAIPPDATLVCGVARPERFVEMVKDAGIRVKNLRILPDHHIFRKSELRDLQGPPGTMVLTTEKDAHRLSSSGLVSGVGICYLRVLLSFADPESELALRGVLQERRV